MIKKCLVVLFFLCVTLIAQSAMVKIRFGSPSLINGLSVNGLPVQSVKVYYGSQINTYTNSVIRLISNDLITNSIGCYDPYGCVYTNVSNFWDFPVTNLTLGQQFFYAVSFINSNGQEGLILTSSVCAFIVTNNSNGNIPIPVSPQNLRSR